VPVRHRSQCLTHTQASHQNPWKDVAASACILRGCHCQEEYADTGDGSEDQSGAGHPVQNESTAAI